MNLFLKRIEDRELTLQECILWDPWSCIVLAVSGVLGMVGIFLLNKAVGEPLLWCSLALSGVDALRMCYLWRRRKSYDFSKSRDFFKRYAGVVTGIDVAIAMVMIVALVAMMVDIFLL